MPFGSAGPSFNGQVSDATFYDEVHMSEPSSLNSRNSMSHYASNPGSFASEPAFAMTLAGSNITPSNSLNVTGNNTYVNRAAKATGALARFGKAIYGINDKPPQNPATPAPNHIISNNIPPPRPTAPHVPTIPTERPFKQDELNYTARSEIVAMGPSPTENAVAIAGKDCKYYLFYDEFF